MSELQLGKRHNLRAVVRGAYDIQKLRIQIGNRVVANMKVRMGQTPGKSEEEELDEDAKVILAQIRTAYKRITDGVVKFPGRKDFEGDTIIADYTELCLVSSYIKLEEQERQQFKQLDELLEDFPIWTRWMKGVRGCGPMMAAVIVSEIDITKARYVSSLWAYAGLDVANGAGRSRKAEHLVKRGYTNAKGEAAERMGITFNPFLKTKLVGVLASSFLKQKADACKYRKVYDDYKHRLECHPEHIKKTKGHRHAMAMRYATKVFLQDLYVEWRTMEGLPVERPYSEGKLGMMPHAA